MPKKHRPPQEPMDQIIAQGPGLVYRGNNENYNQHTSLTQVPSSAPSDRIPSTNPGAEPPRDARDSGSARSHSTHLETSSSDRP